jgi:hypothetical protein
MLLSVSVRLSTAHVVFAPRVVVNETRTADAVGSPLDEKRTETFCLPVAELNAVLASIAPVSVLFGVGDSA